MPRSLPRSCSARLPVDRRAELAATGKTRAERTADTRNRRRARRRRVYGARIVARRC